MEKKVLHVMVSESITFDADPFNEELTTISELKKTIEEFEELGATHVIFSARTICDESDEVDIEGIYIRKETDEEFEGRQKRNTNVDFIRKNQKLDK